MFHKYVSCNRLKPYDVLLVINDKLNRVIWFYIVIYTGVYELDLL